MLIGRLRYGLKIGGIFKPKGSEIKVYQKDEILKKWPDATFKTDSQHVAVQFDHLTNPTILHFFEIEL